MCLRVEKIRLFYLVLYTVGFGWFSWSAIAEVNQKHTLDTNDPSSYTRATDIQACNAATRQTKDGFQWVSHVIAANANASWVKLNSEYWYNWELEAKRRGLSCGVTETSSTQTALSTNTQSNTHPSTQPLRPADSGLKTSSQIPPLKNPNVRTTPPQACGLGKRVPKTSPFNVPTIDLGSFCSRPAVLYAAHTFEWAS